MRQRALRLQDALQQPVTEKTHAYGSVKHQSGCTVATVFLCQKTKSGKPDKPRTYYKQQLFH